MTANVQSDGIIPELAAFSQKSEHNDKSKLNAMIEKTLNIEQ